MANPTKITNKTQQLLFSLSLSLRLPVARTRGRRAAHVLRVSLGGRTRSTGPEDGWKRKSKKEGKKNEKEEEREYLASA